MSKHSGKLLILMMLVISVTGQRTSHDSRAATGVPSSAPQPTNVWAQPGQQTRSGSQAKLLSAISGGASDTINDPNVRQVGLGAPPAAGHSPLENTKIDTRVAKLESSVNEIEKTLELLLDWLCQLPKESHPKTEAGTLACNRGQKTQVGSESSPTGVVEEPSRVASVGQVDRARTRSQTNDDGWSTVGAGGTKPAATRTTEESSGRPIVSSGPITTADLQTFTEELLQKDTNNVFSQLRVNRQGQTNSRAVDDQAQGPLVSIPSSALNSPTFVAFQALLDNYNPDVKIKDVASNAETLEQNNFLNEVMKTQVMQHTEHFLTTKGKIRRPLKDVLKEIWFTMYRRAGRNEGSSGFEHSFIGELKDGKVSGFHNWIQFGHEEEDGDLDYQGFMKYVNLGNKGQVIKVRFNWMNEGKPVGSLFVGTSPELEMAIYTVCFLVKPDQRCPVKLNKKKFNIQTWTTNYQGKKLIGSAYPDI